jgi:hypothetical protein
MEESHKLAEVDMLGEGTAGMEERKEYQPPERLLPLLHPDLALAPLSHMMPPRPESAGSERHHRVSMASGASRIRASGEFSVLIHDENVKSSHACYRKKCKYVG